MQYVFTRPLRIGKQVYPVGPHEIGELDEKAKKQFDWFMSHGVILKGDQAPPPKDSRSIMQKLKDSMELRKKESTDESSGRVSAFNEKLVASQPQEEEKPKKKKKE